MARSSLRAALAACAWLLAGKPLAHAAATFADGPEAFRYLHAVATHQRCVNCHGRLTNGVHHPTVADDLHRHPMNVSAALTQTLVLPGGGMTPPALGTACMTCHQVRNADHPRLPPGAADDAAVPGFRWAMPPRSMMLRRDLTRAALCHLWTDRNPDRDRGSLESAEERRKLAAAFVEHVETDPLIHWGFDPGPGREPVPLWDDVRSGQRMPPSKRAERAKAEPLYADLVEAMKVWTAWLVRDERNRCESL
jgi:hypothetical protein